MAKQLTNLRLLVLQGAAALSSLHQNIRVAAATKSHGDTAAMVEETDKKPAERVSSRALLKTLPLCAALGPHLFADINTHMKIMVWCIKIANCSRAENSCTQGDRKGYFSSINTVTFHFRHQAQLYLPSYIHQLWLFSEFLLFTPISYNLGYLDYDLKLYLPVQVKKSDALT